MFQLEIRLSVSSSTIKILMQRLPLEGKLPPQAADEVERQKTALKSN